MKRKGSKVQRKNENYLFNISLAAVLLLNGCATYQAVPLMPDAELESIKNRSETGFEKPIESKEPYIPLHSPLHSPLHFPLSESISLKDGISLAEANTLALFYSPKILETRSELNISEAILLEAGSYENPNIFLGPRLSTSDSTLIFPASLSFSLPLVSERDPKLQAALKDNDKNRWLLIGKEIEILALVQKQAIKIRANTNLEKIAIQHFVRSKELISWVESLYSAGKIDSFSLQVAKRGFEDAKNELMTAQLEQSRSRRSMFSLIGLLPNTEITSLFEESPLLNITTDTPILSTLTYHPSLKALEDEYHAAEQNLRAEMAQQYPHIQIGPDFESEGGNSSIGLGIGFEIPIFTRNKTEIAKAEEKRNQIRNKYHETMINLLENHANLSDELKAYEDRIVDLRKNALDEAKELDKIFLNSLQSNEGEVLEALGASDALAHTLSEDIELQEKIDSRKIDLLLTSAALVPKELTKMYSTKESSNEK